MDLLGYTFQGPYSIDGRFNDVPGIYLILTAARNRVVDVGQTDSLGRRIPNHDRKLDWRQCGSCELWFHHEASEQTRLAKESQLRATYAPLCGER